MAWFKVDDGFWSHPKTAELSDAATALWVRAGAWSAQHLTDGRIPYSALRFFRARRRSAMELVDAGLWSDAGDAFVFHAWDEYQPSKSQVEAKREATRNRVNAWRERQSNAVTNASQDDEGNAPPDPTRPDPTLSTSSEVESRSPRERGTTKGTRLPIPFEVTDEMRSWARENTPNVPQSEHERFVDYWAAQPGQKGVKTDWVATWRNWMRRANDAQPPPGRPSPPPAQLSKAARNAAEYQRIFGGDHEHAGSVPALDAGIGS